MGVESRSLLVYLPEHHDHCLPGQHEINNFSLAWAGKYHFGMKTNNEAKWNLLSSTLNLYFLGEKTEASEKLKFLT